MFRQFRVAATGLSALQEDLLTITNNVANVETIGFKKSRVEYENLFPEVLNQVVNDASTDNIKPSAKEFGSGVRVVTTPKDFSPGSITNTNNQLDMCIQGNGLFKVRLPNGEIAYTRAGNMQIDSEGRICDPNGNILEPELVIPSTMESIAILTDGTVTVQEANSDSTTEIGQIELVRFQNPSGLESLGGNLFKATVASGEPIEGLPLEEGFGEVVQYATESSNVDIISELTRMVIIQRAFDVVSKSVQTGEAMLNSAIEIARS